jgi:hypothetical protein
MKVKIKINSDTVTIETIDSQLELYSKDMKNDFKLHLDSIDNTLHKRNFLF